jgi:hypothetical protein
MVRGVSRTAVGVAAIIVAAVIGAGVARADVTAHLGRVSDLDSTARKVVVIGCPEGTTMLGGSAELFDAPSNVHVTGWMPIPAEPGLKFPNSVVGYAEEGEGGDPGNWRVGTNVLCGPAPAGLVLVSAHSANNSATTHTAVAECPRGTRLVSPGGNVHNGAGQALLTTVEPDAGLTSVTVVAHEDANGYGGSWSVSAYALCGQELPELELVMADTVTDSSDSKSVTAFCPRGADLHGAGVLVSGQVGRVHLTGVRVVDDWIGAGVDAVEAAPGVDRPWSLRAYAICAAG